MKRNEFIMNHVHGYVLDIGCGDAMFLWEGHPPSYVVCLDIDVYPHMHVIADARLLPFRDNSFDTIIMAELLEHVDDVEAVLKEGLRVARDVVIISYPNEDITDIVRHEGVDRVSKLLQFEREHGLIKTYGDERLIFMAHMHWKDRERIQRDIETIRKYCNEEYKLDYELYDGYRFICRKSTTAK